MSSTSPAPSTYRPIRGIHPFISTVVPVAAPSGRGKPGRREAPQRPHLYFSVVASDLVNDLAALSAQAPSEATLVVFHSAVLAYVSPSRRRDFAAAVGDLDAIWLSNEGTNVLAELTEQPTPPTGTAPFVLARDGRTPLAFTDPHGTWIQWLTP